MEIKELYSIFCKCGTVTTDSRTIRGGELFFALKGENFDGNEYASKALDAGAAYAVVNESAPIASHMSEYIGAEGRSRIIPVPDTLRTLQDLARYHREHVLGDEHLTVIGITGTNGKTTTKELIRTVLSAKYNVIATEGNFNNDIGVPLSLLKITPATQLAVIEMGANHPDDIAKLVQVCEPDYGIITNVGKAHLLGFGSFEGVQRAKGQLYDYVNAHGRAVFVNEDDQVLRSMCSQRAGLSIVPYGLVTDGCQVLETTPENPYLRIRMNDGKVLETKLVGAYNAANALAAICIGKFFEVPEEDAIAKIAEYVPSNSRSQMVKTDRNVLIVDAYNANPSSMRASLANFFSMSAPAKAVMIGDMGELGDSSAEEHDDILKLLINNEVDKIFLVGKEFGKSLEAIPEEVIGRRIYWFASSDELAAHLSEIKLAGYTILIKGSRSMRMEKTVPEL